MENTGDDIQQFLRRETERTAGNNLTDEQFAFQMRRWWCSVQNSIIYTKTVRKELIKDSSVAMI